MELSCITAWPYAFRFYENPTLPFCGDDDLCDRLYIGWIGMVVCVVFDGSRSAGVVCVWAGHVFLRDADGGGGLIVRCVRRG